MLKSHNVDIAAKIDLESKVYSFNQSANMLRAYANILQDLTQAANQKHATVENATLDDKLTLKSLLDWGYTVNPIPNRVLQILIEGPITQKIS